ncbi:alpha/beta fold hydrolase [Acidovorax sp. GBBC 3334]|uniref:alpha/beta fold hydrolase n=1 Tax=Acidovorax sp. GBBC 3334 TaxID=2940496 RepID=UPI0023042D1D|nr:alpha/beta fold hydrolase [Acidovorax sp. GBBC 3334]MDA8455362.1 alpha/beta fold hydrolase [Acidovorax sp. GBBC 3334]
MLRAGTAEFCLPGLSRPTFSLPHVPTFDLPPPLRPRTSFVRTLRCAGLLCLALVLGGCAGVTVSSVSPRDYLAARRGDALTTGRLSPASEEVLRVIGTDGDDCEQDEAACRAALMASTGIDEEQRLSTLSELWLLAALQTEGERRADAPASEDEQLGAWLEAARHAWAYLFFTPRGPDERAFEDRQTQVRDYYNFATQQALAGMFRRYQRAVDADGHGPAPDTLLQWGGWRVQSDASDLRLPSDAPLPHALIAASTLRFSGLRNTYRRDGFGAELVTVMQAPAGPDPDTGRRRTAIEAASEDALPFREMPYPSVTALLRFSGKTLGEVLRTRDVQVSLYDPHHTARVDLAGRHVPLAGNFTAGYGLWLARSEFALQALRTLLGQEDGLAAPRIHLMQPYDPARRTIVMLHGLASSPEAWINVANEVLGDERLRQNYQVWQVYYPTNMPLWANRQAIQEALERTIAHFDPAGTAPASRDMVLVGHSMGGVLARLLVSESGDTLWKMLLAQHPMSAEDQDALRPELDPFLRFRPLPQVGRAIFIAAPHRGTPFANQRLSRWFSNLVTLPLAVLERFSDVTRRLARTAAPEGEGVVRLPNSIDNLSDTDPFVQAASELPIAPRVPYHSIMGREAPEGALAASSDGIVPYASAHLEGAVSERVVPSGHSVQEQPAAILEIRRILRDSLPPASAAGAPGSQ